MTFQGVEPLILALFIAALALMPMLLIVCTAFLKIIIVLMITRNAIGVQQVPPSMALNGTRWRRPCLSWRRWGMPSPRISSKHRWT